ncbi:MAG TPA: hypothetical protein VHH90_09710 [Polyangia bacterium]|nr:hypothetical protein [Polyangia bacterium]
MASQSNESRKPSLRLATAITGALAAVLAAPAVARADVAAVYAEGHGGFESEGATPPNGASSGGLGFRLGARVLIFEGYYDYTDFGGSAAVSRGILGLRGGFGTRDVRLVLRAGGGVIDERGGALTGARLDASDHVGAVGRIGAALEARLAPMFLLGLGIDGETFIMSGPSTPRSSDAIVGSDVFANLHLMFEVGL